MDGIVRNGVDGGYVMDVVNHLRARQVGSSVHYHRRSSPVAPIEWAIVEELGVIDAEVVHSTPAAGSAEVWFVPSSPSKRFGQC